MKMSFRWYGESDPISLEYISQIPGMHSIVSAVYDVKPGEVWPEESLAKMKAQCEAHGLVFDVVESIPVHEDIKLGRNNVDELLDVYCENIRRCAKYGVKCVTYNFMPVFDWTRTQLDKKAPDGSTSLVMYWDQMNGLDPLKDDIHLPGWDSSYSQEEVRELINAYGAIGEEGLWKNLEKFLKKVIPVAEECGVVMAIHPDDPPYPIFGLPRIITCEENLDRFLALVNASGISSSLYLQNTWSIADPKQQAIPMALAIGRELLEGTGAIRVHGGGFAGTIQAFVPVEKLTAFKSGMEKLLGTGMCHILHIRPQGGCVILA